MTSSDKQKSSTSEREDYDSTEISKKSSKPGSGDKPAEKAAASSAVQSAAAAAEEEQSALELLDPESCDAEKKERDRKLLNGIQGNILKGHGRDHVRLIFLKFTGNPSDVKSTIRRYVAETGFVPSALEQLGHIRRFNLFGVPGPVFSNVLLSATGYSYLGFNSSSFIEEPEPTVQNVNFVAGAREAQVELNDPPVGSWDPGFRQSVDALLILADDDTGRLSTAIDQTIQRFDPVCRILMVQSGDAIRNANGDATEHFGYIDGRSQPLFLQQDIDKEINVLDGDQPDLPGDNKVIRFDPRADKSLVLVPDPLAEVADENMGSYFVFRKLEQDVRGFKHQEQLLADRLGLTGSKRKQAGAFIVGRFEDGTPAVLRDSAGLDKPIPNNFEYGIDAEANKCPFAAHIRKMNPRGDIARVFGVKNAEPDAALNPARLTAEERSRRIARRGITFGEQTVDPTDPTNLDLLPSSGVGLLFMCFQRSIPKQFAFLQKQWANRESFIKPGTGIDPLIGQPPIEPALPCNQKLEDFDGLLTNVKPIDLKTPLNWGQAGDVRSPFSGFVTMRGGEFFFAPSLAFLRNLGV